jgi:predicted transposase/invertase (TIGR01784 family)
MAAQSISASKITDNSIDSAGVRMVTFIPILDTSEIVYKDLAYHVPRTIVSSHFSWYTLTMDYEILPPTDDWIFKLLFGDERNKSMLADLLKSFVDLPQEEYELTFLDPYLKPEAEDDKLGIVDVKVRTKTGKIIDIEIQVNPVKNIGKRISFYKSKLIVEQIGKSELYSVIQRVICICITNYELFPGVEDYLNSFRFYNWKNGLCFEDIPEELYTLELPKVPVRYDGTGGWEWMQFLRAKKKEEFEMIAAQNPEIRKAVDTLYELSADEKVRAEFEMRQKAWRDRMSQNEGYYQEGLQKKQQEIARNLKNMGIPISQIAQGTGLTEEEINELS